MTGSSPVNHENSEQGRSGDLRQAMERAGVADQPDLYFLDEIEKFNA